MHSQFGGGITEAVAGCGTQPLQLERVLTVEGAPRRLECTPETPSTVFEGLSYRKVGEAMDMSPQAVKSTMFRARAALRERLAPYVEEDNFTPQN